MRRDCTPLSCGVACSLGPTHEAARDDTLRINARQNTLTMTVKDNAIKYSKLEEMRIGNQTYAAVAYMTASEDTSKGVCIHGVPESESQEVIEKSLVTDRNPTILHARRMGHTNSIVIVFEGTHVPHYVYYRGAEYRCLLYKTKHEVCEQCGRIDRRLDVCPNPNNMKCRGCGIPNPTYQCTPSSKLCGKQHITGEKKCTEIFRTPYLLKKRQWERTQQEQQRLSAEDRTSCSRERPIPKNTDAGGNGRGGGRSRSRSRSYPKLPQSGGDGVATSHSTQPVQGRPGDNNTLHDVFVSRGWCAPYFANCVAILFRDRPEIAEVADEFLWH
ncbi:hypothetical protein HPB49_006900 [Dermacentor silvarum]|uniref:Uncharacterized protein n=1 Tax=Dermacentor silvarum TaxID=543639 RepID=A0ACB8C7Y1_DERSI|nr:hypothetical protein HPB49_006900 [Dermacentor silvarum]